MRMRWLVLVLCAGCATSNYSFTSGSSSDTAIAVTGVVGVTVAVAAVLTIFYQSRSHSDLPEECPVGTVRAPSGLCVAAPCLGRCPRGTTCETSGATERCVPVP